MTLEWLLTRGARYRTNSMARAYVYILTNRNHTTLYVGVTSQLVKRVVKHRNKYYPKSFSARYNVNILVYYECFDTMAEAIAREKQLKAGSRKKKIDLINKFNPEWQDLLETLAHREESDRM